METIGIYNKFNMYLFYFLDTLISNFNGGALYNLGMY